jgi:preprotein translocase subunit SecY
MEIIENIKRAFYTPEIRKKVIYTAFILIIYRILANIPTPGINTSALSNLFSQNQFLGLLNVFSGGTFANFAIIAIGLTPFITSSVIIQLLTSVVPRLEELQQEGERGRRVIVQMTRLLTVPLAVVQSLSVFFLLKSQNIITATDILSLLTLFTTLTAGSMLLMWLGENLTEDGVGQGISLLIACNVLSALPHSIIQTAQSQSIDFITVLVIVVLFIVLIGGIVFINEAVRNIPLNYTKRIRGNQIQGGTSNFLPMKVNTAGVMPAIFAISMIVFPLTVARFLTNASNVHLQAIANNVVGFLNNQTYYAAIYFVLVFIFTYFYAFIVFNPEKVSQDLQKQGGFIPGIRPGERTADYLSKILGRITFIGAIFLGVVVTLPIIMQNATNITTLSVGGTGLIIVIGVVLQIISQLKSYMVTRSYENFAR